MRLVSLCACVMLVFGLLGCGTNNQTSVTDDVELVTSPANAGRISGDGNLSAAYHGLGATLMMADETGLWGIGPGPEGKIVIPFGEKHAYLGSPRNARLEGVEFDPETGVFRASLIELNISEPIAAMTEAVTAGLVALEGMNREAALAEVEKWRSVEAMSPGVLDTIQSIVRLIWPAVAP